MLEHSSFIRSLSFSISSSLSKYPFLRPLSCFLLNLTILIFCVSASAIRSVLLALQKLMSTFPGFILMCSKISTIPETPSLKSITADATHVSKVGLASFAHHFKINTFPIFLGDGSDHSNKGSMVSALLCSIQRHINIRRDIPSNILFHYFPTF